MSENVVLDKSHALALRSVRLYKYLCREKNEYVLSKQVVESDYLAEKAFNSIVTDCQEIMRLLTSIVKSSRANG